VILTCPECRRRYRTDPARIPPGGGFVRCPACKARIEVRAPEVESASLDIHAPPPPPPPTAPPAPPTPAPPSPAIEPPPPPPPEPAPERPAYVAHEPPAPPPEPEPEPEPERAAYVPPEPPPEPEPTPARAAEPPEIFIRTDGGSYIARNVDELRKWIFEGRLLREDLISHAGGPEIRADEHQLTSLFFETAAGDGGEGLAGGMGIAGAAEASLTPGAETLGSASEADAIAAEAAAAAEGAPPFAADEGQTWPSEEWPGEEAFIPAVPEELTPGARAIGVIDLLLSLIDPIGLIAAIGLLMRRAWGRALTILWAVVRLLLIGGVAAAVLEQRGASSPLARIRASMLPEAWEKIAIASVIGTIALLIYLIWVILYLRREEISARFKPGGARAAVILGMIGYLVIWFAAWQWRASVRHDEAGRGAAPSAARAPVAKAPPPAAPAAQPEISEGRAFTFDGLASIDVAPGWRVRRITEGEPAKLGVLLEGDRDTPAGTLRLIAADPADLARQDQRFATAAVRGRDIRDVEEVRRGEFVGRKVITAFPVDGGTTGYLTLSLHDSRRGYQFRCSAKGPDWSLIEPDCEAMAASLLVSAPSSKPQAGGTEAPSAPSSPPSQAAPSFPVTPPPTETAPPRPAAPPPSESAPAGSTSPAAPAPTAP
jgi:predicted Zn finger-like uncharacterized protein